MKLHPLDIVAAPDGSVGIVACVFASADGHPARASVAWTKAATETKAAWWDVAELKLLDSLPSLLTRASMVPYSKGADPFDVEWRNGKREGGFTWHRTEGG